MPVSRDRLFAPLESISIDEVHTWSDADVAVDEIAARHSTDLLFAAYGDELRQLHAAHVYSDQGSTG